MRQTAGRQQLAVCVTALAVFTAIYCAWPIWRALFPLEIDLDEAREAFNAAAVLNGRALYPDPQGLIANNYPPLSLYLVSALSTGAFDAIYAGRALSLVGVIATTLAIAICIRVLGGTRLAAVVAGLWFLATMARFFNFYVGENQPEIPALAIAVSGLAWALHREKKNRAVEPAILILVIAGFYKNNHVATPAAALVWISMNDWRRGLRASIVGVLATAAGLALCTEAYGINFIYQLLHPREYSWRFVLRSLSFSSRLQWIAPAIVIWAIWAWYDRGNRAARFTTLYIAASFLAYLLLNVADLALNTQFELVTATAIGLGMAFSQIIAIPWVRHWGTDRSRAAIVAVLVFRLLISGREPFSNPTRLEPYLTLVSPEFRAQFYENSKIMEQEIERIRHIPGPVYCSVNTVCYRAGKPFVLDSYFLFLKIKTGRLTRPEFEAQLRAAGIKCVTVDHRTKWPPMILGAGLGEPNDEAECW
jgi:hypothetical protein